MIVFIHIPRTGGTSLRHYIRERLPVGGACGFMDSPLKFAFARDDELHRLSFLATHCGVAVVRRLPPSATKMVVLRHPIERIVSLYHHLRRLPDGMLDACRFAKSMSLRQFVECDDASVTDLVLNAQTWQLFSDRSSFLRRKHAGLGETTILAGAIANLRTFEIVGVTSALSFVFAAVDRHFGWPATGANPRENSLDSNPVADAETVALIEDRVALDMVLYEAALHLVGGSGRHSSQTGNRSAPV